MFKTNISLLNHTELQVYCQRNVTNQSRRFIVMPAILITLLVYHTICGKLWRCKLSGLTNWRVKLGQMSSTYNII